MRRSLFAVIVVAMAAVGTAWGAGPSWLPNFPLRAGDSILLMWIPLPGAASYNIYRAEGGGAPQKIASTPAPTYTDAFADKTKTVSYTIRAVVNGQEGDPSQAGTIRGIEPLQTPKFTGNRLVANSKMAILWSPVPRAAFYNVYKAGKKDGEYKLLTSVQDTQYVDAAVKDGEVVYYRITAVDASSIESARSEALAVKVEFVKETKKAAATYTFAARKVRKLWTTRGEPNVELAAARALALTRDGKIAIAGGREIQIVDKDGKYVSRFAQAPSPDKEVAWGSPVAVAVGPKGEFLVAYQFPTVLRIFAEDGTLLKEGTIVRVDPKTTTDGYIRDPIISDADFAADGTIWAAENSNFQLIHLDADLKEIGRVGKPIGDKKRNNDVEPVGPGALLVNRKTGRFYVTEPLSSRVSIYGADGKRIGSFGEAGDHPGGMNLPSGLALSPKDELYVGDSNLGRIQVFTADGKYLATILDADKSEKEHPDVLGSIGRVATTGDRIYFVQDIRQSGYGYEVLK